MMRKQSGGNKVRVLNSDGHAIGLDIGATRVRAAVLSPAVKDGMPAVTANRLGEMALPPGAVVNGVVQDQGAVSHAIRTLWSERKFDCHNVILGITHQQSVVRDLEMPHLSPDMLAKALPYQAREIVPFPMDQAVLNFLPLSDPNPQTDLVRGLLIAVPRAPVLAAVHAVEKAGLKVARVDLSSFAVLRSMTDPTHSIEAVIDMGCHMTNIVIHHNGVPRVVRTVSRGGDELTRRIVDRASLNPTDAELAKCVNGVSGRDRDVVDAISEGIRPLLAEIRSSVHYFSSTNGNATPERICLTGGAANLPGFAELLSDQLGIPAEVIAPMQHIRNRFAPDTMQNSPEQAASAVSVGLAMGAAA
jgi:type IV pilus assembly protein PilM